MQSPPIEWAMWGLHLAVIDLVRDHGEADGDTLTECLRTAFRVHTPRGRRALAVSVAAGGVVLYRHLVKPEMRHQV